MACGVKSAPSWVGPGANRADLTADEKLRGRQSVQ